MHFVLSSKRSTTDFRAWRGLPLALCALVALGLAGSVGAQTPPTDPPPFQEEEVKVALGENGGTLTLMTAEGGGFTLDGEAFTGGADNPVTGEGGRMYVLTLAEGTWTAAFLSMEVPVTLGTSGESVTLTTTEAGFEMDGAAFASGGTATSSNGGRYTLTMDADGRWMAAFVPETRTVTLGTSGDTVELVSTETGWALGSSAVIDGYVARAENGNRYRLTLDMDGMWSAAFIPTPQIVDLGASRDTVTVITTEAGGWAIEDGPDIEDGAITQSSLGQNYQLSMGDDGQWSAMHQPMRQTVTLGGSDVTVELATNEQGGWMQGDETVASGDRVPGAMNDATGAANEYELTLVGGEWRATYRPVTMIVAGTGLTAVAREDGSGYAVGEASLPASGTGDITGPDGALWRVTKDDDGMLAGTRFDLPIVGSVLRANAAGTHGAASLSADNPDTEANEAGTKLNVVGASLSMADLLGGGSAAEVGPNLVADALDDMVKIRDRVAAIVELRRIEGITSDAFDGQITRQWEAAEKLVRDLFGNQELELERTESQSRVVDAFSQLVAALSSEEAFAAATLKDGPGRLQGFAELSASNAAKAFNRTKWTASSTLGTLGSTRFGAAVYNETPNATTDHEDAERAQGFAWSTMESTLRASDVQTAGSAYYAGRTHAADQEGNLYTGTMSVEVRFAPRQVDGLVRQLEDAESGSPWEYGLGGEVTSITLPTASLERRGSWRVRTGDGSGRLSYVPQAGSRRDVTFTGARFSGRLLGRGDQAGSEAIGTWRVVLGETVLAGGFGAQRDLTRTEANAALKGNLAKVGGSASTPASVTLTDASDPPELNPGGTKLKISADTLDGNIAQNYVNVITLPAGLTTRLHQFSPWVIYGIHVVPASDRTWDPNTRTLGSAVDRDGQYVPIQNYRYSRTSGVGPELRGSELGGSARTRLRDDYVNFDDPEVFELDRAKLFALEYPVTSTDDAALVAQQEVISSTRVSAVRAEVIKQRNRLQRLIDVGEVNATFANDGRQQVFAAVQNEMRKIFGPDIPRVLGGAPNGDVVVRVPAISTGILTPATTAEETARALGTKWTAWQDYPVNSSDDPQDSGVLAEIDDVIAALENLEAFEAAFDSGGIFASQNENPVVAAQSLGEIYNRPVSRLLLQTGTTDFTRFGAWRKQEAPFAAHQLIDSVNEESRPYGGTGAFVYSPLDPTQRYLSTNQREYPASGSATNVLARYRGATVAAQNDQFYTGDVEARVQWNAASVGGAVRVTVSNLMSTDPQYGALQYGRPDLVDPALLSDVRSLTFAAEIVNYGSAVGFSSFFDDVVVDLDTVEGRLARVSLEADSTKSPLQRSYDGSNGHFSFNLGTDTEPDLLVLGWTRNLRPEHLALGIAGVAEYTDVPLVPAPGSAPDTGRRLREAQRKMEMPVALNNIGYGELEFVYLDGTTEYWTRSGTLSKPSAVNPSSLEGGLEGRFIGNTISGPVGLMGTWELNINSGLFGVGTERGPIRGSFGAELVP